MRKTLQRQSSAAFAMGFMSEWHLGDIASFRTAMGEAISLSKELNDMNALAMALAWAAGLASMSVILPKWTAWQRI